MGLKLYVTTRLLLAIPMLFIVVTSLFFALTVIPGDPVEALYGKKATKEFLEEMRHRLGLDKPILNQYVDYLLGVFSGDLGYSIRSGKSVTYEIGRTWPVTIQYCILTTLFAVISGLLLGIISALKKNKIHDFVIRIFSLLSFSMPAFWLSLLLQFVFSLKLGLFPLGGLYSLGIQQPISITGIAILDSILSGNLIAFVDILFHLVLPSIALTAELSAVICRVSRANLIETSDEDYINTARAKGLRESAVLYKHALRNAFLPVITILGWEFTSLLGGSVIIEQIFALPGMGNLLFTAIITRDYPLIRGVLGFFAVLTIAMSVIVDIVYAVLDPRIRYT